MTWRYDLIYIFKNSLPLKLFVDFYQERLLIWVFAITRDLFAIVCDGLLFGVFLGLNNGPTEACVGH